MMRKYLFIFFVFISYSIYSKAKLLNGKIVQIKNKYGVFVLDAKHAVFQNNNKIKIHKYFQQGIWSIGHWVQSKDIVKWSIYSKKQTRFEILIEISCPEYTSGSHVKIQINNTELGFKVPYTKSWAHYSFIKIGSTYKLNRGQNTFIIKPEKKTKSAVMNIRKVILIPASVRRSSLNAYISDLRRKYFLRKLAYPGYKKAYGLYRKKTYNQALNLFIKALKIDRNFGMAAYYTGIILRKLKRYGRAYRYLQKAVLLMPFYHWAVVQLIFTSGNLKRYKSAVELTDYVIDVMKAKGNKIPYFVYANASYYARAGKVKYWSKSFFYLKQIIAGDYKPALKDNALASLAEIYRYSKDYDNFKKYAFEYFKKGINSEKKGNLYYHLANITKGADKLNERYYYKSIKFYKLALNNVKPKRVPGILKRIGYNYYKLNKMKTAYKYLSKAYKLEPSKYNKFYLGNSAYYMGIHYLVNYEYSKAKQYIRFAYRIDPKTRDLFNRLMFLCYNHGKYKNVKPHYVHKILQIFVLHTNAKARNAQGKLAAYKGSIDESKIKQVNLTNKLLKIYVETLTYGKLTLNISRYIHNGAFTRVKVLHTPFGVSRYCPDTNSITNNFYEKLFSFRNKYDTFVYFWKAGKFVSVATGGAGGMTYAPYSLYGPIRGVNTMPFEWRGWRCAGIFLHEFWHTMENLVKMPPIHGWTQKYLPIARRNYPDWKGTTEWSLYLYHSKKTIPAFLYNKSRNPLGLKPGYRNMNFLLFREAKLNNKIVAKFRKLSCSVPMEKAYKSYEIRQKANEYYKIKQYAKALTLYISSLKYNPYNYHSYTRIISIYARFKQKRKQSEYYKKIMKLFPSKENVFRYAALLNRLKKYRASKAVLINALKLYKSNGFRNMLARVNSRLGYYKKSEQNKKVIARYIAGENNRRIILSAENANIISRKKYPRLRHHVWGETFALGYWYSKSEYPLWKFRVNTRARYRIKITLSCSDKNAGRVIRLNIGKARFTFNTPSTRHYFYYRTFDINKTVFLKPGMYKAVLKAMSEKGPYCNIRKVVLQRVD